MTKIYIITINNFNSLVWEFNDLFRGDEQILKKKENWLICYKCVLYEMYKNHLNRYLMNRYWKEIEMDCD